MTAMITCTLCARARTIYVFSGDSVKCSEYTRKSISCNGNFLEADFDKLSKEKAKLEATQTRVIEELISLHKRIKAL
jgi:hypothetical protein